jgi:hypothetical protein
MERDDTMRKAENQEGSRCQEVFTRLASVYLDGRSNDSLGQVLVFQGHHLIAADPGFMGHAFGLPPLPAFLPSSFAFLSMLAF